MKILIQGAFRWDFLDVKSVTFNSDFTSVTFSTEQNDYHETEFFSDDPEVVQAVLRYPESDYVFNILTTESQENNEPDQEIPIYSEPQPTTDESVANYEDADAPDDPDDPYGV